MATKVPSTVMLDFAALLVNQRMCFYMLEDGGEHGVTHRKLESFLNHKTPQKAIPFH